MTNFEHAFWPAPVYPSTSYREAVGQKQGYHSLGNVKPHVAFEAASALGNSKHIF
jgi:hypothetical protein